MEDLASSKNSSGVHVAKGVANVPPYALDSKARSPKSDIQTRGGASLLVRILDYDRLKLVSVDVIVALKKGKTVDVSMHLF